MQSLYLLYFVLLGVSFAAIVSQGLRRHEKSGKWLRNALSSVGDAVVTTDKKGRIRTFNEVAEKLTEWEARDAMRKPVTDLLHMLDHDTRTPLENITEKALKTGNASGLIRNAVLVSRSGKEWPVDFSAAPIRGKSRRIHGAVLIFRDITERYAAEQKLLESEERLKAVTDTARIGLVMIDRERRYVYANNYYQQMLGISNLNMIGKRVGELLPVLYEQIRPNLDRAFAGERLSYEVKGLNKKELGLNRIYSVTYEPQERHSLITHVVIVVLDITDHKRAPEPLPGRVENKLTGGSTSS